MIFQIKQHKIEPFKLSWGPKELEVEDYILPSTSDERILHIGFRRAVVSDS